MTQESWVDRDSHPDGTVFVRYNTGQPMGVYSSWPVFALCHHLMVRYAAYRVGVNPVGLYMVLGDDVSIACEKLAHEYRRLLVDCLGVDISIPKSYIPNVLKGIRPAEFAKQLVSHTRVITPLTPDLLEDTFGYNWPNLVVIVRHLVEFWRFKFGVAYTDLPRFIEAAAGRNTFKAFGLLCWPRFPVMPRCYREGTIMTKRFGP